jgi:membrane fusion protein (multidrug efflux system)
VSAYAASSTGKTGLWADKARLRRVLMFGGVGFVLAVAGIVYLMGGRYVTADDSYIHANKLMVATDVSGLVKSVNVHDVPRCEAGGPLP